jgi:hypothetical protein
VRRLCVSLTRAPRGAPRIHGPRKSARVRRPAG